MEHPAIDILKQVRNGKRYFAALPLRTANAAKMLLRRNGVKYRCLKEKKGGNYNIVIL